MLVLVVGLDDQPMLALALFITSSKKIAEIIKMSASDGAFSSRRLDQIEILEKATSRRWIRSKRARSRRKEIKQIRDKVIARYYSRLKHLRQKYQKINARQHHSTESDFHA